MQIVIFLAWPGRSVSVSVSPNKPAASIKFPFLGQLLLAWEAQVDVSLGSLQFGTYCY